MVLMARNPRLLQKEPRFKDLTAKDAVLEGSVCPSNIFKTLFSATLGVAGPTADGMGSPIGMECEAPKSHEVRR